MGGWLIRLNLLKLKLVEHILNFSRFHCDDGLIHWLTSSRFIVYWCFFVICSPSFERERERERERVLDSHNHPSRFVLVHLAWPRDGNIFFLLSAHILQQKNMKKWSSMTKIFALEFGKLPFWILFFSFLPFFQFWSNMSFIYKRANKCNKGWFCFVFFFSALKNHSKTNRSTLKAGVLLTILLKWRNPRRADILPHPTLFFSNKDTSFLPPIKIATLQLSTHEPCEFLLYHRYGWSSSGPPFPIQHSLGGGWISMVSPCNIHWRVLVHCGPFSLIF